MNEGGSTAGELRGSRVLVFGASGFIGRWVLRCLRAEGVEVFAGIKPGAELPGTLSTAPDVHRVQVDITNRAGADEAVRAARPAVVFNLAGYGVDPSERDGRLADEINSQFVTRLADACARYGADNGAAVRLVHVGSALEYGRVESVVTEEQAPQPTTLYGRTKLAGTEALRARCARGDLRGVVARLFTVYGPGEHPSRLLPTLVAASRTGASIPLTAGEHPRDFAYVGDVADFLVRLARAPFTSGDIVHVATGVATPVRTFVETAARHLRIAAERLNFGALPTRDDETMHPGVSVSRLVSLVGGSPSPDLDLGVTRALLEWETWTSAAR